MLPNGYYYASGEFAIQVGIPAKSGVSGGIMAIVSGQIGISVLGSALSSKGNSVAGVHLLQSFLKNGSLICFEIKCAAIKIKVREQTFRVCFFAFKMSNRGIGIGLAIMKFFYGFSM